jgi:hypothetical protein
MIEITILTKQDGPLTKRISLAPDGAIKADGSACLMSHGRARRAHISSVDALAALLEQLTSNQAIALGALRADLPDEVVVIPKDKLNGAAGVIARTRKDILYKKGHPALALLDHDAKQMPLEISNQIAALGFWGALIKILPVLRDAAHVIRRSTSAGLHRTDTGAQIPGSRGLHIFIVAQDGTDIARFLTTLHDRCWLAGMGWLAVGSAGQLLDRSIIDRVVGMPERLVFEGQPILVPPVTQDAESRRPIARGGNIINTATACPSLTVAEQTEVTRLKAEARQRLMPEAEKVRAIYVDTRAEALVKSRNITKDEARRVIGHQCRGLLLPDVELVFVDKELEGCTVGDILDDPERFRNRVLADPIEGIADGRTTAMVMLRHDGMPWINSFSHGGVRYTLEREAPPDFLDDFDGLLGPDDAAPEKKPKAAPPPPACSLEGVHIVFRKWLGDEYDLDAIDAVCATGASERLTGDPLWLLIVSGPGAAKTETVQALSGADAQVTSTIASEGALLSASPKKGRAKTATGGLLRKIGDRGILVIKDVTSILSSDRNTRGAMLAAIREIYDGRWERNVGTDGGQTLTWTGRVVIVGAVTTAWDAAHAVVAAMGDRFVLIRIYSNVGRKQSGKHAIRNTGSEEQMRKELADAVGGLIAHACIDDVPVLEDEETELLNASDIVTMARTGVERDYRGDVAYAHAPEMPTRFAKELTQMVRGGVAVGMSRKRAMQLAIRCARDSIPPLRLEILLDIAVNPGSRPTDVRKRITKPWTTTKREMEALQMLGILLCKEETIEAEEGQKEKTTWLYSLAPTFDRRTLLAMAGVDVKAEAFMMAGSKRADL